MYTISAEKRRVWLLVRGGGRGGSCRGDPIRGEEALWSSRDLHKGGARCDMVEDVSRVRLEFLPRTAVDIRLEGWNIAGSSAEFLRCPFENLVGWHADMDDFRSKF